MCKTNGMYVPLQTSDPASSRIHSFLTTFCAVPMDRLTYPNSSVQDYRRNSEPGPLYLLFKAEQH